MARQLVVTHDGATSTFDLEKLERARLYGTRRRVPLDTTGEPCQRAALTRDGRFLLRPGMTAQGWFTDDGVWVPPDELQGLDAEGQPLPRQESTLGVAQAAQGPLAPTEVLDLLISAVYLLDPVEVAPALAAALDAGALFRVPFRYRPGFEHDHAVLVRNEHGTFALIGRPSPPTWVAHTAPPPLTDDDAPFGDDLDFEMFG